MMLDIEEDDVTFDEAGLLDNKQKQSKSSIWCQSIVKILCLSLAFFSLGLCIAIPGPTLIDLGERVQTDTTHMALVFTARSVGYLLGALVGGFLFDIFDKQLLLCVTLFLASLATCVIPWALTLIVLAVMFSLQGIAMGVLDTGGNALCVRIWGRRSSPYIQAMHFAFGIGAFIAPLLSQPFLHEVSQSNSSNPLLDGSISPIVNYHLIHLDQNSTRRFGREDSASFENGSFVESMVNLSTSITQVPTTTTVPAKPKSASDKHLKPGCFADGTCAKKTDDKSDEDNVAPAPPTPSPGKQSTTLPSHGDISAGGTNSHDTHIATTPKSTLTLSATTTTAKPITVVLKPMTTPKPTTTTPKPTTTMPKPTTTTPKPTTTTPKPTTTTPKPTTTTPKPTTTTPKPTTTTPKPTTTTPKPTTTTPKPTTTTPKPTTTRKPTTTTQKPSTTPECIFCADLGKDHDKDHHEETPDNTSINPPNITEVSTVTVEISTAMKPQTVSDVLQSVVDTMRNMSKIQFSYTIIAGLLLVNAIIFLILFCYDKGKAGLDLAGERDKDDYVQNSCVRLFILLVMFLFFLSYIGMETTYGGLIMTFTVKYMDWTKNQGAIITAIFWGSLAAGRGFSIFIAGCCKPRCMLIMDLILIMIGATMLTFVVKKYSFILWLGTLLLGLGMSSIFPTGLAWTEQYFRMTGKSTAVLVMGSALGQMILPVATGYTFEKIDRMYLMYVVLILSVFCSILFMIMQVLASKCIKVSVSQNGFMPLHSQDNIELDGMSYGTTQDSTRRRLLPTYNDVEYDQLPQDGDFELD